MITGLVHRCTIWQPQGATIDAGPFAVQEIVAPTGRAEVAYRRLTLRRLISIDQT